MAKSSKVPVESFVAQCRGQMIPLSKSLSYFSALPLDETELRKLLYDPVSAVPPRVGEVLPNLRLVLVPYLEKRPQPSPENASARARPQRSAPKVACLVTFQRPARSRLLPLATSEFEGQLFLFLGVRCEDLADYHDAFFHGLARLISDKLDDETRGKFDQLVREELLGETHGEIDEKSWRLKEQILRRRVDPRRNSKSLQSYLRQALIDTLTLYLHGLCCDIDIEAGPRQLASRHIRRRLVLLRELLPPPAGFALFPEEV